MTIEQIVAIKAAAQDCNDTATYNTAWIALGFHRHPAFMPATPAERERAVAKIKDHK